MLLFLLARFHSVENIWRQDDPHDDFANEYNTVSVLALLLAVVSLAVSIPSATGLIPVKPFRNRYVCAVARKETRYHSNHMTIRISFAGIVQGRST
ncbi:hypothetical protein ANCCAN_26139 [Ancylostoma caninum]|uniref:Uncharacterized protein n=1 Tax=Ancylostoma caninum TaxID=29170 RepID=A0A368F7P9_ANCCA|nr:hypothetical protein ANCCAN_26139 [Ancylostoma caninum]